MPIDKPVKPYCTAPWHSVCVGPTGDFGPCCMIQSGLGSVAKGDTLESVWKGELLKKFRQDMLAEKFASHCLECKEKENNGIKSARSVLMEFFNVYGNRQHYTDEAYDHEFYHLDISLSNKCNLKCRFCGTDNSTAWIRDRDALVKLAPKIGFYFGGTTEVTEVTPESLLSFMASKVNLGQIELKGGEPFMSSGHLPLLESLIETGQSKKLKLFYTTNGTMFNEHIFSLFKYFKHVSIAVSVDGLGSVYQYVRGGRYSFESDVEPQLHILNKMRSQGVMMNIHFVVNAYNLLNLSEFFKWFEASGINSTVSIGLVETPPFLSVKVLPPELIARAIERLTPIDRPEVKKLVVGLQNLRLTPELRQDFAEYTRHIDNLRGVSLVRDIPELAEFYLSLSQGSGSESTI